MKTFKQFILEAYDPEVQGRSQIRKQGQGGRVGTDRKKSEPEKRKVKAVGGGKTVPAKTYKARKDIGTQKPRSKHEQQPEKERGSAALSSKEAQKKAYKERKAREKGAKTKTASELLSKKKKKSVHPDYKVNKGINNAGPSKGSYTAHERRKLQRAGDRLIRDIKKGKEKSASHYDPKS